MDPIFLVFFLPPKLGLAGSKLEKWVKIRSKKRCFSPKTNKTAFFLKSTGHSPGIQKCEKGRFLSVFNQKTTVSSGIRPGPGNPRGESQKMLLKRSKINDIRALCIFLGVCKICKILRFPPKSPGLFWD